MDGRLSGERYNKIVKAIVARYDGRVKFVVGEMLASGYPPFTVPLSPLEQYQKLLAMEQAGDPAYTGDPRAQAALAKLAVRFGQPGPISGAQVGVQLPVRPNAELGANLTSNRLGPPPILGGP